MATTFKIPPIPSAQVKMSEEPAETEDDPLLSSDLQLISRSLIFGALLLVVLVWISSTIFTVR